MVRLKNSCASGCSPAKSRDGGGRDLIFVLLHDMSCIITEQLKKRVDAVSKYYL